MGTVLIFLSIIALNPTFDENKKGVLEAGLNLRVSTHASTYSLNFGKSGYAPQFTLAYKRPKFQYELNLYSAGDFKNENKRISPTLNFDNFEPYIEQSDFKFLMLGINFSYRLNSQLGIGFQFHKSIQGKVQKTIIYNNRNQVFQRTIDAYGFGIMPFIDYSKYISKNIKLNARFGYDAYEAIPKEEFGIFNNYGITSFVYSLGINYVFSKR